MYDKGSATRPKPFEYLRRYLCPLLRPFWVSTPGHAAVALLFWCRGVHHQFVEHELMQIFGFDESTEVWDVPEVHGGLFPAVFLEVVAQRNCLG